MRVRFADFRFDSERRELTRRSQPVHLSPKALLLLETLLAERPKVIRKQDLQSRLWPDVVVDEANLTNVISELRTALGDDPKQPQFIRTAHGYGYAFIGEAKNDDERAASPRRKRLLIVMVGTGFAALAIVALFIARAATAHVPVAAARLTEWPFRTHKTSIVLGGT